MALDGIELADVEAYARQIEANGNGPTQVMTWHTPLSAFEPWDKRYNEANGYAVRYTWHYVPLPGARNQNTNEPPETRYVLMGESTAKIGKSAIYLMDDGSSVVAYYGGPARDVRERDGNGQPQQHTARVNPYGNDGHRLPNPEIDPHMILSPITPLDGWQLAPKRAYHVKVRPV